MSKTICFINEKGGVGKTSTCFNIGWEMALNNKKILMIDIDGQKANLSFFSGIDEIDYTLENVLKDNVEIENAIVNVTENLDIIPADSSAAKISMDSKVSRFKKQLDKVKQKYDYIFIDVTPSPGWIHYLALSVSDYAVIVMLPDIASLEGNRGILESVSDIQETSNPNLKIAGFLFNKNNDRTAISKQVREAAISMAEDYDSIVFNTRIPQAVGLSECVAVHAGITSYDPTGKAAVSIRELTAELEEIIHG